MAESYARMEAQAAPRMPPGLEPPRLTGNAVKVLEKRYLLKDSQGRVKETPQEMFWRIAWNLAQADRLYGAGERQVMETARTFYHVMARLDFLPNSPTIMNAGTELQQLSACFVLPVGDSLPAIFDSIKQQALIHQSGGGTGFGFSRLRPKGDFVRSTMGVASGPVSFMKIFNAATQEIKQGGKRRGANMGILRVDHPDIEGFITCKDDVREVTNFNISVAITDEFMRAVKEGKAYALRNPRDGKPVKELDARAVLDKVANQAWKNGEPGLFFIDRSNEHCPTKHITPIEATNPCLTADAWVHTAEGPRQVRDLVGVPFMARLDARDHPSSPEGFFRTATKRVVELRTKEGHRLRLTSDHRVRKVEKLTRYVLDTAWCEAGALRPGDRVLLNDHRAQPDWEGTHTAAEGYLMGLLMGDGTLQAERGVLSVWVPLVAGGGAAAGPEAVMKEAMQAASTLPHRSDFRGWSEVAGRGEWRLTMAALRALATEFGMGTEKAVTPAMERASSAFQRAFLRGFFDTDGTVLGDQAKGVSVRLAQSDLERLRAVQRMLLRLGIASRIYTDRRPAGSTALPDGRGGQAEYATKAQHELCVSGENLAVFAERVGFADADKAGRLHDALRSYVRGLDRERFVAEVEAVEEAGTEDVFDAQVPGVHAFDANGFHAHNCGEQDLQPYDSCNLGSIDLQRHVTVDERGQPAVDWEELEDTVRKTTHLLDNVIDMNNYPIPEIREMSLGNRRIGLGIMGFARLLFAMGIPYDSEEGLEMAERVMKFVNDKAIEASCELAKVRGPYPNWKGSEHEKQGVVRRNSYVTTIAPTGTLSMIADTSGGCEPEFSLVWYKNVMDGTHLPYVCDPFVEVGRREGWWRDDMKEAILANRGSARGLQGVPEKWQRIFAVSFDVTPEWHVRMQAAFQAYVEAQVSKTINLPAEATKDDVMKAYLLAYELGCRGITVYRDQSRPDQVLNVGESGKAKPSAAGAAASQATLPAQEKPRTVQPTVQAGKAVLKPRPRPDVITGTTQRIETGYGHLYVTINEDEHGLFEVFAQIGHGGGYTASFTEAVARLVSLCLRSGVPVEEVVEQMEGIRSPKVAWDHGDRVFSVPDALAKALQRQVSGELTKSIQARVDAYSQGKPSEPAKAAAKPITVVAVDEETENEAGPDATRALVKRGDSPECPECEGMLTFEEGCVKCHSCGYSEC